MRENRPSGLGGGRRRKPFSIHIGLAIAVAAYGCKASVQAWADGGIKPPLAVLGAEEEVEHYLAERLGHRRKFGSGIEI